MAFSGGLPPPAVPETPHGDALSAAVGRLSANQPYLNRHRQRPKAPGQLLRFFPLIWFEVPSMIPLARLDEKAAGAVRMAAGSFKQLHV